MEMSKEEFTRFIQEATSNPNSDSFVRLYQFLLGCFVRADTDMDGKVFIEDFDKLITEAAELPRRYGFAPKDADMYKSDEARKEAREKMFKQINTAKDGYITFEEWVSFSVKHIKGKAKLLPKDRMAGEGTSKKEFLEFTKKAVEKSSPEHRELYHFLLKCFVDADSDRDGCVNAVEFDAMIEKAAAAPRRYNLAPSTKKLYKTDAERLAKRTEEFKKMDVNDNGKISFDEWLSYAVEHITGKVHTTDTKTNGATNGTSNGNGHTKAESEPSEKKSSSCTIL